MSYEVILHPDVERRLGAVTDAARESIHLMLAGLSETSDDVAPNAVQRAHVRSDRGEKFSVQVAVDHEHKRVHVLGVRPEHPDAFYALAH